MALTDKLTAIADAIRVKTGGADLLTLDEMAEAVSGISGGGGIIIQTGSFTPAENLYNYTIPVDGTVKNAILYKINNTIGYGVRCMIATAIFDGIDYQPVLMTNGAGSSFAGAGGAKLLTISDGAVVFASNSTYGYLCTEQYNWMAW